MDQKINPLQTQGGRSSQTNNTQGRQRMAASRNASAQTGRTVGSSSSNYGVVRNASSLHVGDVIRGEITDLRNSEISITLEDNTVVHGQISDSASYSIGQTGSFRLADIAGRTIYLENISAGYSETELTLINKALEEANLPATERNQATVKALMDNLLPINRDSIQNLMQQAYDVGTEDMNTLAVMNRLMMKTDADSVEQFSNYRNDNYQLLGRLNDFAQSIPSLLNTLAENGPADAVAAFGKNLLSISQSSPSSVLTPETIANLPHELQGKIIQMLSDTPLTEDIVTQLNDRTLSLQDTLTLIRDAALSGTITLPEGEQLRALTDQINHMNQVLEPTIADIPAVTEDFVKNIATLNPSTEQEAVDDAAQEALDASQTAADTANADAAQTDDAAEPEAATNRFSFAGKFLHSLSENAKNTFSGTLDAFRNATAGDSSSAQTTNQALQQLTDIYEQYARNHDLLNTYLSSDDRNELFRQLQDFPISRNLLMKIASGEASTKEVMTVIHNAVTLTDNEQVKALFSSPVFEKLFARELQSTWTLTPEQLAKENLSDFYSKLRSQMRQYQGLIQSTLSGEDSQELSHFAHDIEQNISFMKTLNETFSYFQLPLKLPSQDAHSDLYVYTQKERLRQNPDKASVLLHLDMEHLGTVDVRINKNRNDISAQFSLDDADSINLFRVNETMLKDALAQLGYQSVLQFNQKEEPSPTVDTFINTKINTHATDQMKRFSFDIRA